MCSSDLNSNVLTIPNLLSHECTSLQFVEWAGGELQFVTSEYCCNGQNALIVTAPLVMEENLCVTGNHMKIISSSESSRCTDFKNDAEVIELDKHINLHIPDGKTGPFMFIVNVSHSPRYR